jgi:serine/threonine-protein kinase
VAARRIRREHPGTAVVVLSQHVEPVYAQRLLADQPGGLGYLLKERVSDIERECVIDPTIVASMPGVRDRPGAS